MSMENAILEHAAALNNLAQALHKAFGGSLAIPVELAMTTTIDGKAAELAGATKERAAKARDAEAKDAQQNAADRDTQVLDKAEMEKAVATIEKAAKAGAKGAEDDDLDTPLDYAKDVRPVLLAAIKKAGKDKVQELINGFGVDKADKVDPAKFGKLLAGAQLLAA